MCLISVEFLFLWVSRFGGFLGVAWVLLCFLASFCNYLGFDGFECFSGWALDVVFGGLGFDVLWGLTQCIDFTDFG